MGKVYRYIPNTNRDQDTGYTLCKNTYNNTLTVDAEIEEEYQEALIYYAVKEIALRINPQLSQVYEAKWAVMLEKASSGSKILYPERTKSPYRDF